jgi:hypothetical protein
MGAKACPTPLAFEQIQHHDARHHVPDQVVTFLSEGKQRPPERRITNYHGSWWFARSPPKKAFKGCFSKASVVRGDEDSRSEPGSWTMDKLFHCMQSTSDMCCSGKQIMPDIIETWQGAKLSMERQDSFTGSWQASHSNVRKCR